ncbi:MAG: NPCBM/NEW2 domain-containing protein [Planctomycetota bacterium]
MRKSIIYALLGSVVVLTIAAVVRLYLSDGHPPASSLLWQSESELPVDLSGLFNNDGVASAVDPSDTNFDCPDHPPEIPGSGYPAEHLPASGIAFNVPEAGRTFLFPVVTSRERNNVECQGQRIAVAPQVPPADGRVCREIAVLGAAENGAASADVELEYEDGSTESVELSFPDWCAEPAAGEIVAAAAPCRYTWDMAEQKNVEQKIACRLYVRRLPVDTRRILAAVVLPERPNLHIFAMTLAVSVPGGDVARRGNAVAMQYRESARIAKAPAADLKGPVEALADRLRIAEQRVAPEYKRQLVWLRTQYEHLVYKLRGRVVRSGSTAEGWALETVAGIRSDIDALLRRTDPFRRRRGHILKGYVSEIDGQVQPYAVYVPGQYAEGTPSPLVVHMHGHGWYKPFQCVPTYPFRDAVVVSPHGRGSIDYMFVAEEDVLACIDEAKKDYTIDADRVYLLGSSMGGTGCWSLATKYPSRFAAIGPVAGNADSKAWEAVAGAGGAGGLAYDGLRSFLRESLDPVTYAGNLLHVSAYFLHGDDDEVVPVGNSRSMARALAAAGCRHAYREGRGGGHGWRPDKVIAAQHDFIFGSRRSRRPERVRLKAAYLKYGRADWIRIVRLARRDRFGEVAADVRDGQLIDVKLRNVSAVEIDLNRCPVDVREAVVITIDGERVFSAVPLRTRLARLERSGSRWQLVSAWRGPRKKPYLEGPVSDAYTRSFLVVIGTRSADAADRRIVREEAERFAADWKLLYTRPPRVKADQDVNGDDIARHNLILYGGPQDNSVTARIAGRLPIEVANGAVRVGGRSYAGPGVAVKFCYPNPLNPERLVVIVAGASRGRDVFQSNNLFGNWFQWGPYDNRAWFDYAVFDDKTRSAETCIEFGFFDDNWQLCSETTWFGDPAARRAALGRRIPTLLRPPDRDVVHLSDLAAVSIEQHKLPVGFDTSAKGRALSIGVPRRVFRRGLGVRPPSKMVFAVSRAGSTESGRFTSFRATVGIDLEDADEVALWRGRNEWVKFLVYGDGRLLHQTAPLRWRSKPVDIDVPISGVERLELETACPNARWLVGSAAWADARIIRAGAANNK